MKPVRLGIIGLGEMGCAHARQVRAGAVPFLRLAAVADLDPARLAEFAPAAPFTDPQALIDSGAVDAVLVATPHFSHAGIGCAVLRAGLHLLVEKPVAAQTSAARRLLASARRRPRLVSAVMFNQRTDPLHRRLRTLLQSGELGAVRRAQWTLTHWFRSAAYYRSSPWRATWAGEGGGVLLNQCVHQLDLLQWFLGSPRHVRAHCAFGRYHDIEVEDDVTAYCEYPRGTHVTLITSTGEAPGTNRLEIAAEGGQLVLDQGGLTLRRNAAPMSAFSRTTPDFFAAPAVNTRTWHRTGPGGQHREILRNFTAAILRREPLIAPLTEGLASLELANALLLSAWTDERIALPLNAARYDRELARQMARSRPRT
jgi:predicted dehydrogenase